MRASPLGHRCLLPPCSTTQGLPALREKWSPDRFWVVLLNVGKLLLSVPQKEHLNIPGRLGNWTTVPRVSSLPSLSIQINSTKQSSKVRNQDLCSYQNWAKNFQETLKEWEIELSRKVAEWVWTFNHLSSFWLQFLVISAVLVSVYTQLHLMQKNLASHRNPKLNLYLAWESFSLYNLSIQWKDFIPFFPP